MATSKKNHNYNSQDFIIKQCRKQKKEKLSVIISILIVFDHISVNSLMNEHILYD